MIFSLCPQFLNNIQEDFLLSFPDIHKILPHQISPSKSGNTFSPDISCRGSDLFLYDRFNYESIQRFLSMRPFLLLTIYESMPDSALSRFFLPAIYNNSVLLRFF